MVQRATVDRKKENREGKPSIKALWSLFRNKHNFIYF